MATKQKCPRLDKDTLYGEIILDFRKGGHHWSLDGVMFWASEESNALQRMILDTVGPDEWDDDFQRFLETACPRA